MQSAVRMYLHQLKNDQNASDHTLQAYRTDLEQFIAVINAGTAAPLPPEALSESTLKGYAAWLAGQGYKKSTISRKFAALRSFMNFLASAGLWRGSDLSSELQVPYEPRKLPRMLDGDELTLLIEAPQRLKTPGAKRDAAILSLLYETGFRASEIVDLRLADVQLSQARLRHPSAMTDSVPIPSSSELLRLYLQEGRPHLARDPLEDVLFLNQRGKGLTRQGLWLVVKRWAAAAGIPGPLSPHTLRHTRARDLLHDGVQRREVQRMLGLSSPNAIRIHGSKHETE